MILFCRQFVTVQSQAKFQKRYKMLAFFRLFLKFYLADTPTSKMHSILEVSSEQLQYFGLTVCKTKIILIGDEICLKL